MSVNKKRKFSIKKAIHTFQIRVLAVSSYRFALIGALIMLIIVGSMYVVEGLIQHTGHYNNLWDVFWWFWVTASTVGYGDKFPQTFSGQVVGLVAIFFGVVMVGSITASLASLFLSQHSKEQKGLGRLKRMKEHFIICGWKREMASYLKNILDANKSLHPSQIVLVNTVDPKEVEALRSISRFKEVRFIAGDYVDEQVLMRANIKQASKVLILADESSNATIQEIDSKTVMAVFTIESLNKKVHTCAELMDAKYEKHLSHCNEIILSREYNRILIANASSVSGLSHVVRKLLDVESTSKLSTIPIPETYINQPFKQLQSYVAREKRAILIGLLENTGNFFERKNEALKEAQKTPDIAKLLDNLNMVKQLKANDPVINPEPYYVVKSFSRAIIIER